MVLTGHAMYVAIQATLANIVQTPVNTPPANNALPMLSGLVAYADAAPSLVFSFNPPGLLNGFSIAVGRPQTGGVTFLNTFRQFVNEFNVPDFYDATDDVVAAFGPWVTGQNLISRFTPYNSDGVSGAGQRFTAKAVAAATLPLPSIVTGPLVNWTGGLMFTVYVEIQAGGTGPWAWGESIPNSATGAAIGVGVTGDKLRCRISDGMTFSARSNVFTI
jgi:hypothetical protein